MERFFWRDAVLCADPEDWQKAQWGDALKWFFDELTARDVAGCEAYTTEKAYSEGILTSKGSDGFGVGRRRPFFNLLTRQ